MIRAILGMLATMLLGAGVWLFGEAAWIHGKAVLAQYLIEGAWREVRTGETTARPWPWADMAPVALLEAPQRDVRLIVLSGATGRTLAFGPARIDGSAAASGNGTVVLAGHRDTHFSFLKNLIPGDLLVLTDREGRRKSFRVVRRDVADARTTGVRIEPADGLVLFTCYPFDAVDTGGPLRYVVTAFPEGPHRREEDDRAVLRHALDERR